MKMVLSKMVQPAVEALDNWGALAETPHGKKTKQNFLDSFDSFIQYMDGKSFNQNVDVVDYGQYSHIFCFELRSKH